MMTSSQSIELERMAVMLDANASYRVLRALPPLERFELAEPEGRVRTAAVVDVETTGLSPDCPIIDLAIQRIAFDARGRIVEVGRLRQWFEDPRRPIPPEITRLTGITDHDVAGQDIDDAEAMALIGRSDLAIAHNAAFDAPRVEHRLAEIAGHAWACSCIEVPWAELGFEGRKLGHLLMQCGLFHQGHRAATDVWATINLLGHVLPDGETPLAKLLRRAAAPSVRIAAAGAPFMFKQPLKLRGYRWDPVRRHWWLEIERERLEAELAWLAEDCCCRNPEVCEVTWRERHRG